jgi:hypothetical protein
MSNKKKVSTYCTPTKDGKLNAEQRDRFVDNIKLLAGERCKITVEKLYNKHSPDQREYYFAVVCQCAIEGLEAINDETYTKDEAHEFIKTNCLYDTKVDEQTGEIIRVPKSISTLDLIEMIEYIERASRFVEQWLKVQVPPANREWRNNANIIHV